MRGTSSGLRVYVMQRRPTIVAYKALKTFEAEQIASKHECGLRGAFVPRTELGRRLWRIRQKILQSKQRLLDWDGIESEVRQRRGDAAEEA
jgi:hypothetical protein